MTDTSPSFWAITLKSMVVHTVTYFVMGVLAFTLLDYSARYADPGLRILMRQTDDFWVMVGPAFQPLRGVLFGVAFFLLRGSLFGRRRGWLVMWAVLVIVGILATFGPAPSSIEGVLYTVLPFWVHVMGLPEVVLQALLLSALLCYWVDHPQKRWLTRVLAAAFVVVMIFPLLGVAATTLSR
jgi:hypothetical protein